MWRYENEGGLVRSEEGFLDRSEGACWDCSGGFLEQEAQAMGIEMTESSVTRQVGLNRTQDTLAGISVLAPRKDFWKPRFRKASQE